MLTKIFQKSSRVIFLLTLLLLASCQPGKRLEPVTLIIGSWYGFYPFYYAVEHQLDRQYHLRIKILEPTNISNLRRSYLRSQVDLAATSMLEFVNSVSLSKQRYNPILITDYSNGGDVIIADKSIQSKKDLAGKRIAVPSKGIGEYILSLVFDDPQPGNHFEQHKIPETECEKSFASNSIDACVTYPPISTYLLQNKELHTIYSSKEHAGRVFDVVWAKPTMNTQTIEKVKRVWFEAVKKIKQDPEAFHDFVASIANVTADSVKTSMEGIRILNEQEHDKLLSRPDKLGRDLVQACRVAVNANCEKFSQAFIWAK